MIRTLDLPLGTIAWRVADGLILFLVCALCARGAEPMPYIPWLPPPPGPCDGKTFVTLAPQFDPDMVTPPGLNANYTPTTFNNQNTRGTNAAGASTSSSNTTGSTSGTIGSGYSSGWGNTVIERDRSGEVVGTPVVSSGRLSSPVGAVQNQWLDDKQLTHQWAPPKVDAMFMNAGHNCADPSFCPHPPPTFPPFGCEVDGILLHRNRANIGAFNTALGIVPDTGDQVDLGSGGRVKLTFLGIDHHDFEVLFFGTDAWSAEETFSNLQGATQNVLFTSQLFNWEVNFRRRFKEVEWLTFIYGVRYIEFSEDFDVPITTPLGQTNFNVGADNYLFGAQIGLDLLLWQPCERWKFEALAKFGCYGNNASNYTTLSQQGANVPGVGSRNHFDPYASVGELGFNGTWNIHRQWGIKAGYLYTIIDNVAMAPDSLGNDSRTHTLTVHGGYVGGELRW